MDPIPAPSPWSTIFAGENFSAKMVDDTYLSIKVRQMKARDAFHVLGIIDTEVPLIEFVCVSPDGSPLPVGWIDGLTPESHGELVEKARSLNFPVVLAAVQRQMKITEALGDTAQKVTALTTSLTTAR